MFQMKFVVPHTRERLPGSARRSERRANALGFVPNLLGVMAEAPIAMSAYIDLTGLLGKASLNAVDAPNDEFRVVVDLSGRSEVASYGGFDEGRQKSRSMQQNSPANVQRSDEQMCLLYGATARVVNRHGGSQSTNSFSPALCS
jgi:hypothetical protein